MSPRPALYRYAAPYDSDPGPQALTRGQCYARRFDALSARHGFIRIIDNTGEDYLYPAAWFSPVDGAIELPEPGNKPAIVLRLPGNAPRIFSIDDFAHLPGDILVACMLFSTSSSLSRALRLANDSAREAFAAWAKTADAESLMRSDFLAAMTEPASDAHWRASMTLLATLAAECESGAAASLVESEWFARSLRDELDELAASGANGRQSSRL